MNPINFLWAHCDWQVTALLMLFVVNYAGYLVIAFRAETPRWRHKDGINPHVLERTRAEILKMRQEAR